MMPLMLPLAMLPLIFHISLFFSCHYWCHGFRHCWCRYFHYWLFSFFLPSSHYHLLPLRHYALLITPHFFIYFRFLSPHTLIGLMSSYWPLMALALLILMMISLIFIDITPLMPLILRRHSHIIDMLMLPHFSSHIFLPIRWWYYFLYASDTLRFLFLLSFAPRLHIHYITHTHYTLDWSFCI